MELYLKLIDVIFPVFALVGVGYYLGKKNPNYDTTFITNFASKFGSPALAFYAITSTGVTFDAFVHYFFLRINSSDWFFYNWINCSNCSKKRFHN